MGLKQKLFFRHIDVTRNAEIINSLAPLWVLNDRVFSYKIPSPQADPYSDPQFVRNLKIYNDFFLRYICNYQKNNSVCVQTQLFSKTHTI